MTVERTLRSDEKEKGRLLGGLKFPIDNLTLTFSGHVSASAPAPVGVTGVTPGTAVSQPKLQHTIPAKLIDIDDDDDELLQPASVIDDDTFQRNFQLQALQVKSVTSLSSTSLKPGDTAHGSVDDAELDQDEVSICRFLSLCLFLFAVLPLFCSFFLFFSVSPSLCLPVSPSVVYIYI